MSASLLGQYLGNLRWNFVTKNDNGTKIYKFNHPKNRKIKGTVEINKDDRSLNKFTLKGKDRDYESVKFSSYDVVKAVAGCFYDWSHFLYEQGDEGKQLVKDAKKVIESR